MDSYKNVNFIEAGDKKAPCVVLLHGTLLNTWQYQAVADELKDRYHIIMPIIDGHAGSAAAFESINDCAVKLLDFIQAYCNGHVDLIGGLSLGGQIVLEMLAIKNNFASYAIIESTSAWAKRFSFKAAAPLSCRPAHLSREQTKQYFDDLKKMEKEDVNKIIKASAQFEASPSLRDIQTKVFIEVGSAERGLIGESEDLHHLIDHSQLMLMYRYKYGDFSMKHTSSYVNLIEKLLHRVV